MLSPTISIPKSSPKTSVTRALVKASTATFPKTTLDASGVVPSLDIKGRSRPSSSPSTAGSELKSSGVSSSPRRSNINPLSSSSKKSTSFLTNSPLLMFARPFLISSGSPSAVFGSVPSA